MLRPVGGGGDFPDNPGLCQEREQVTPFCTYSKKNVKSFESFVRFVLFIGVKT